MSNTARAITAADVTKWTEDVTFHTPPENQGQIVLVSYGCDEDYIYEKTYDQSDRSTVVRVYEHPETDCDWDPWNGAPSTGDLVARVEV
jgi:hypothetical protein